MTSPENYNLHPDTSDKYNHLNEKVVPMSRAQRRANERIAADVQLRLNIMVRQCMLFLDRNAGNQEVQAEKIKSMNREWKQYINDHPKIEKLYKAAHLPRFGQDLERLLKQVNNPPKDFKTEDDGES